MLDAPFGGNTKSTWALVRLGRFLRSHLSRRRFAFTLAICALISTQVLFQPLLYQLFSLELLLRTWSDYLVECLLMGFPILFMLTLAEALSAGVRASWRRCLSLPACSQVPSPGRSC